MRIETRDTFKYGIINSIEDSSIPPGAASRSLGWLTLGDRIELTRGRHLLGTEIAGVGRVSGLRAGFKADGTAILFKTYGKKLSYYSTTLSDWVEVGSDILGSGVVTVTDPYGEDISMEPYAALAGAQFWINSPNISGPKKIMVANPDTAVDQYDTAKNFKGLIKIKTGRMWLWNRGPSGTGKVLDKTGLYGSKIDKDEVSDFTPVTAEAIGLAGSISYSGTLSTVSGKKTCFGVLFTDGTESFQDDKNGNLIGSLGGTGTINYATGAYVVNFFSAAAGNVTSDYYTEDSTSGGIADFTKSGTRAAGEGFIIRQDDAGGDFQNLLPYNEDFYCMHTKKTWRLSISSDDVTATNKIFRENAGTPYWRASVDTGSGIYFIDNTDANNPRVRVLTLDTVSSQVIPVAISNNIDLRGHVFDKATGKEVGDYVIWTCRTKTSNINNRLLAYHKIWKSFDLIPYYASTLEILNGILVGGDSLSNNVYELFSGEDDDDSTIENYWEGAAEDLGIPGMKKSNKTVLEGDIGPNQGIRAYAAVDKGAYVEIGNGAATVDWPTGTPAIYGQAPFVDHTQRVDVGSLTLGRGVVGGGSTLANDREAYHYKREFFFKQDRLERVKIKFVAVAIGYASVSRYQWKDIRHKSNKIPQRYRVN